MKSGSKSMSGCKYVYLCVCVGFCLFTQTHLSDPLQESWSTTDVPKSRARRIVVQLSPVRVGLIFTGLSTSDSVARVLGRRA